jgi:hypothetical protein
VLGWAGIGFTLLPLPNNSITCMWLSDKDEGVGLPKFTQLIKNRLECPIHIYLTPKPCLSTLSSSSLNCSSFFPSHLFMLHLVSSGWHLI